MARGWAGRRRGRLAPPATRPTMSFASSVSPVAGSSGSRRCRSHVGRAPDLADPLLGHVKANRLFPQRGKLPVTLEAICLMHDDLAPHAFGRVDRAAVVERARFGEAHAE